jgi:hypothetical protein
MLRFVCCTFMDLKGCSRYPIEDPFQEDESAHNENNDGKIKYGQPKVGKKVVDIKDVREDI